MKFIIEPWKHQLATFERAKDMDNYALFFEMGAGKTATAINLLRYKCISNKSLLRTIILCPRAVVVNWKREIIKNSTIRGGDIHLLQGAGKKRVKYFLDKAISEDGTRIPGIFVTNYESLSVKGLLDLFLRWGPQVVIFDESQRIKSHRAKRTKLSIKLADRAKYKYILSGSPLLKSPMDIWAQFRALDGGESFGSNYYAFLNKWFIDRNAHMPQKIRFPDYVPIKGLEEEFHKRIYRKATRVLKKDCMDLPPITYKQVFSEMSATQERMYKQMEKNLVTYLEDKACVASIALVKSVRLMQIASGFFVSDEGEHVSYDDNPRREILKELLEDLPEGSKCVVWASFRENYGAISSVCESLKLGYRCLYGGMTSKAVQESIDEFQTDPSVSVMIANQSAGGVGISLTAANLMIYYSKTYNKEHDKQSEARAHRGGSEIHSSITRIDIVAPGTIEDRITQALKNNEDMAEAILAYRGCNQ